MGMAENNLTLREAEVIFCFSEKKLKFPKHFQKHFERWMLYLLHDLTISGACDSIPFKNFCSHSQKLWKGFFVVWHSFSFTLEENYMHDNSICWSSLYIFMSTVSFLIIFKTHALSQVICPSSAAITAFMDYGDCAIYTSKYAIFTWWNSLSQNISSGKIHPLVWCSLL